MCVYMYVCMCREGRGLVGWLVRVGLCVLCVMCGPWLCGCGDVVMWLCGFRVIGKIGINCRPWLYAALPFSEWIAAGTEVSTGYMYSRIPWVLNLYCGLKVIWLGDWARLGWGG